MCLLKDRDLYFGHLQQMRPSSLQTTEAILLQRCPSTRGPWTIMCRMWRSGESREIQYCSLL